MPSLRQEGSGRKGRKEQGAFTTRPVQNWVQKTRFTAQRSDSFLYWKILHSLLPEHAHQQNEGQANQGIGVIALHAADEGNAQAL